MDDSPYNLFVMKEIMATVINSDKQNFKIKTAMNGQEALDQILLEPNNLANDGRQSKFDLIFLDLHMPILDGF